LQRNWITPKMDGAAISWPIVWKFTKSQ